MLNKPPVIFYGYDASPFAAKVYHALLLKDIPHKRVNVAGAPPRPELGRLLGVTYRRIPVLAIGRDVYCDTSLITLALERYFSPEEGYGTLFPPRSGGGKTDTGLVKAFSKFYGDTALFPLAVTFIEWDKLPKAFVQDRSKLLGAPISPESFAEKRPAALSAWSTHMNLIEEQLQDGRIWLFDTTEPSLADVSVNFVLAWLRTFRHAKELFDPMVFPKTLKWLERMHQTLEDRKSVRAGTFTVVNGDDAADLIAGLADETLKPVEFDLVEAKRLQLEKDSLVAIAPEDTGKDIPTVGRLVGLTREEFVIATEGTKCAVHCHFPRLGFKATRSPPSSRM